MKTRLFIIILLTLLTTSLLAQAHWQWATSISSSKNTYITDSYTDSSHNVYIAGSADTTAYFGADSLTTEGGHYSFVAMINTQGEWQWEKQINSTNQVWLRSLCRDGAGNFYVSGTFKTDIWAEGVDSVFSTVDYRQDIFIMKLSAAGEWQWCKTISSTWNKNTTDLACDALGNCFILGDYYQELTFGDNTISAMSFPLMVGNFMAKLNTAGNWEWVQNYPTTSVGITKLITDAAGNSYVLGGVKGEADLQNLHISGTNNIDSDLLFAKVNTDGIWQWEQHTSEETGLVGTHLVGNANGEFLVAGDLTTHVEAPEPTSENRLQPNIWVARLDSNGNIISYQGQSGSLGFADSIALDNDGNSYIGTWTFGTATYGPFSYTTYEMEIALVKLNSANQWEWLCVTSTTAGFPDEYSRRIEPLEEGNCLFMGDFTENITFGEYTLTTPGTKRQAFIAKAGTYVGVEDDTEIPQAVMSCYPNPFGNTLTMEVVLEGKGSTTLSVYNIRGQKVKTLLDETKTKGKHTLQWDGRDQQGRQVASGVYYVGLNTGSKSGCKKVVYLKP